MTVLILFILCWALEIASNFFDVVITCMLGTFLGANTPKMIKPNYVRQSSLSCFLSTCSILTSFSADLWIFSLSTLSTSSLQLQDFVDVFYRHISFRLIVIVILISDWLLFELVDTSIISITYTIVLVVIFCRLFGL